MKKLILGFIILSIFFSFLAHTLYQLARHSFASDPAANAQIAAQIAPGAVATGAFVPDISVNLGLRSVIFHEKGTTRTLMLLEYPLGKGKTPDAQTYRGKQDEKSHATVEEQATVEMATRLDPAQVLVREVRKADGQRVLEYTLIGYNPANSAKVVVVSGEAPNAAGEDGQFFREFLSHLDLKS